MRSIRFNIILLFILMGTALFFRFPDFPGSAHTKVIEPYGDGFKSYTTIWYHAKWDTSFSRYGGMNYPYGEHVIPAATQPVISNLLKWITNLGIDVTPYTMGVVNWSLIVSLLLCALFVFLVLVRLEVDPLYSVFAAIGITFLAPQFHRMSSHYGLAHPEVLPILIYLLMSFHQKRKIKYSIAIALVTLLYSGIHFYYFAIIAATVSAYFLVMALINFKWANLIRLAAHFAIQIIGPFLFYLVVLQ